MLLAIIIIIGIAAALIYFWAYILAFLQGTLRSLIGKCFGSNAENIFGDFLVWLDQKITPLKRVLDAGVRFVKSQVLRMDSQYERIDASTYRKTETVYVNLGNGKCQRRIVEEEIGRDQLPDEIRAEMIRQNTTQSKLDEKAVTLEKIKERLTEEGYQEELLILTT